MECLPCLLYLHLEWRRWRVICREIVSIKEGAMNKVDREIGSSEEMANCCHAIRDRASEVNTCREGLCIIPKMG